MKKLGMLFVFMLLLVGCTQSEEQPEVTDFQVDVKNPLCVQFGPSYQFSHDDQAASSNCTLNEDLMREVYAVAKHIPYVKGTKDQFENYLKKWANEDGTASKEILIFWQTLQNGETSNFVAIYDDGRFNFRSEGDKTDLLSVDVYPEKFEQLSKILGKYE